MYISVNAAVCSGCHLCELICSLVHHGECNPELAGVHINKDVFSGDYRIETCRQCPDSPCLDACPVQAIHHEENIGAIVIDEKECTGCRLCEEACPYRMIGFLQDKNLCFKCDLCGGKPQCVHYCIYEAVSLKE